MLVGLCCLRRNALQQQAQCLSLTCCTQGHVASVLYELCACGCCTRSSSLMTSILCHKSCHKLSQQAADIWHSFVSENRGPLATRAMPFRQRSGSMQDETQHLVPIARSRTQSDGLTGLRRSDSASSSFSIWHRSASIAQ